MGHKTKVNPQNRQVASHSLTSVIIDCVDVDWGVIYRLDDAGKGFQSCCGCNFFGWSEWVRIKQKKKEEKLTTDRYKFAMDQILIIE